jgi:hypothetical protein
MLDGRGNARFYDLVYWKMDGDGLLITEHH